MNKVGKIALLLIAAVLLLSVIASLIDVAINGFAEEGKYPGEQLPVPGQPDAGEGPDAPDEPDQPNNDDAAEDPSDDIPADDPDSGTNGDEEEEEKWTPLY